MPLTPILLRPGIQTTQTPTLNSGGWSAGSGIRFKDGLPQKVGGSVNFCSVLNAGLVFALKAQTALSGSTYLGIAGSNRLNLFLSNVTYDITPVTISQFQIPRIRTVAAGNAVTILDPGGYVPYVGQGVQINAPISISGTILYGNYQVIAVVAGGFEIALAVSPIITGTGVGTARTFTTVAGSAIVTVAFPNHGLFTGQVAPPPDGSLAVGGLTLSGNYLATVIDPNTYQITAASNATGSQMLTENSGRMHLTFFSPPSGGLHNDLQSFGASLDNWGEFLMYTPQGGPTYVWQPISGPNTLAQPIITAPQSTLFMFVAKAQHQLMLCGTVDISTGIVDPMLIAWSDVDNYGVFTPLATNQAGNYRLAYGSTIVGALPVPGMNLIWTDLAVYGMQYIGFPLVWSFGSGPLGVNCGLIGPHAMGVTNTGIIFWMSQNQFYAIAGSGPQILPCTVWDNVFKNIDRAYARFSVCATNGYFNEVAWYVPQTDGTVTRACLQVDTGVWTAEVADPIVSAWADQSPFGPPLGAHIDNTINQYEIGNDIEGQPRITRLQTGRIMISAGDELTFVREVYPDFKFSEAGPGPGTVNMTIALYKDANDQNPFLRGPFPLTDQSQIVPCNGRGRDIQFDLEGDDLGSWWRLGAIRYRGKPDGKN